MVDGGPNDNIFKLMVVVVQKAYDGPNENDKKPISWLGSKETHHEKSPLEAAENRRCAF